MILFVSKINKKHVCARVCGSMHAAVRVCCKFVWAKPRACKDRALGILEHGTGEGSSFLLYSFLFC